MDKDVENPSIGLRIFGSLILNTTKICDEILSEWSSSKIISVSLTLAVSSYRFPIDGTHEKITESLSPKLESFSVPAKKFVSGELIYSSTITESSGNIRPKFLIFTFTKTVSSTIGFSG